MCLRTSVKRVQVGSQREFLFPVKDHVELGLALDLFDFEAASEVCNSSEPTQTEIAFADAIMGRISRSGFPVLKFLNHLMDVLFS